MNTIQFLGSVELGLIYGLVALGVYLSFRVLEFPDLTVDGSFPLGAAVAAILIVNGYPPFFATMMASGAGFLAGVVTAWLNIRWKILHLLASILTMTALYSINLRIMGRPNIALLNEATLFTNFVEALRALEFLPPAILPIILAFITVAVWLLLTRFLTSHLGLAMRATGGNPRMAKAQGINVNRMTILGIALSNAIVAFAGALFAQTQGFADVTMGVGTIIIGLAAVIIGEAFFPSRTIWIALLTCIVGAILYRLAVALALNVGFLGLQASDLNLITALLVAVAMILPKIRSKVASKLSSRRENI